MTRCINCWITIPANQQYEYYASNMGPEIISIIEEWISRQVIDADKLCQECVNRLLTESINRSDGNIGQRQLGHESVCVCCGLSLHRRMGRRSHSLNNGDAEWIYIANLISPLQMPFNARACFTCWVTARTHQRAQSPVKSSSISTVEIGSDAAPQMGNNDTEAVPQVDLTTSGSNSVILPSSAASINTKHAMPELITLEGYRRTSSSQNSCFIPNCMSFKRKRVPLYLKRQILDKHKVYVTMNARVCENHLTLFNWDILDEYEFTSQFTRKHVLEMLDLLRKDVKVC